MKELYLDAEGKAAGPYPVDQISEFLRDGVIKPDHLATDSLNGPWKAIQAFDLQASAPVSAGLPSPLSQQQTYAQAPPPLPAQSPSAPNQPAGHSALIDCPDCGRQISRKAPACPQCGRPNPVGGFSASGAHAGFRTSAPLLTHCPFCQQSLTSGATACTCGAHYGYPDPKATIKLRNALINLGVLLIITIVSWPNLDSTRRWAAEKAFNQGQWNAPVDSIAQFVTTIDTIIVIACGVAAVFIFKHGYRYGLQVYEGKAWQSSKNL